ncbi:hypothetical protein [Levilactobacillus angrenensis]|uniref:Uncharacterized protein n=1 Tax=Levilactobacillus angrenensis TaxID=2486020 RepID=A0ABW1U612_9LACO|nr:hypothetical protein [Levilactobacillus angrenensis]
MRVNHILGALLVATTIGIGGTTLSAPTTAQAKAKSSLTTFPKNMRGTWYHYEENNGYYYKSMKFTTKKLVLRNYFGYSGGGFTAKRTLKYVKAKSPTSLEETYNFTSKRRNRVSAFAAKSGYTKLVSGGLMVTDGNGTYKVIHKNYKGKSVKVLYKKADNMGKITDHFYQTKAQAKHFNPVGALHK